MSITEGDVRQIAALAKLRLTQPEISEMAADLDSILGHMRDLQEAEVAGVPPTTGVTEHAAPMREDASVPDQLENPVGAFAPAWKENLFVVPRLAALDAGGDRGDR
jgi:aspartyl-tRNA(Asn)/glutamyl-tRNA(Gln) amidotransferase subunit C